MLTLSLTRRQLYELYYEGAEPTIRLIEDLIEQLADFERVLGKHQQQIIDSQHERGRAAGGPPQAGRREAGAQGVRGLCVDAPPPGLTGRARARQA